MFLIALLNKSAQQEQNGQVHIINRFIFNTVATS